MSRIRAVAGVLLGALALASGVIAAPADAQPTTDPEVTITVGDVSPWVTAEGEWTADLTVAGAPADARLSYSIRQPPTGTEAAVRETLLASLAGTNEPKVMRSPVTTDMAPITDASGTTHLEIPVRTGPGDRERINIPDSGVYPVVVSVLSSAGASLAQTTLYLNHLPVKPPTDGPYRLGILVQPAGEGGFDAEGNLDVTPTLRASVDGAVDTLAAGDGLPLSLVISPETMVALTQSKAPGDLELVERMVRDLGEASVVRVPWAHLHTEGWALSGSLSDVQTSLLDGQQALFARLSKQTQARLWTPDDTLGPNGVDLLTKLGISAVVVDPTRLAEGRPPAGESGATRPFRLTGTADTSISGVALDTELQELLAGTSDSPTLDAHRIVTLMFGSWLADDHARGNVVRIDESADPEVVAALLGALREFGPATSDDRAIAVVDPTEVAALPPVTSRQSGRDVMWTRQLIEPDATPNVMGISDRLRTARPLVDDYAAILPAGDAEAARQAIVVQRSLDRDVSPGEVERRLDTAIAEMSADLDKITTSESRTLTVTSRRTPIPLRFTNDLGRPIKARLRLQSPRLDFLDGDEQDLVLQPGVNRIDVDVEVRASGQFPLQVELLAPGSDRVLASTQQRIRSTTFSGVGLMLSGGALLFLVIWWSRTLRRRDADGEAADDAPAADEPAESEGVPAASS